MTFSIIIPAYNAEAYLSRCLDSIFSQDYEDYEVIVINDGSTDGTATILKRYPQVKVINQSNHGMSSARNRGLEVAQGDYILFVDSDDSARDTAVYLTLVGSCNLLGIAPYQYFCTILPRLHANMTYDEYTQLLPYKIAEQMKNQ